MDKIQLKRFGEATKTFLFRNWSREVLVFLFFVIVSAVFWLMQTLDGTYDMKVEVPIKLTNVPSDVIITTDLPQTLQITLRDKGQTLIQYYYSLRGKELLISYPTYDNHKAYGHINIPHADLRKQMGKILKSSTSIVAFHPDTVAFFFSRGIKKTVPIQFQGQLSTDIHHFLESHTFTPDSATVWGPQDILDTLKAVYTVPTNLTGLTQSADYTLRLSTVWGAKASVTEVVMRTVIDTYVEKTVNVRVSGINFPADKVLRTFPAEVAVHFHVGSLEFNSIEPDSFVVGITYDELINRQATSDHFAPMLRYSPSIARHITIEPDTVEYLIETIE